MVEAVSPYVLVDTRYGPMLANQCDIFIGAALIAYGEYSELETQYLLQWIDCPCTVIEVGANVGSQTVALAKAAKRVGAHLVALEPQPFVFQNLCANLALNALDNVAAWPFAAGAQAGTMWLGEPDYRQRGNFGSISVQSAPVPDGVEVPCVRLDDVVRAGNVRLIKIDVEGHELQVLQGAKKILSHQRPVLYVENDRVAQSSQLILHLWELGYRLWWHITPLFNPENFRGRHDNVYPRLYSFNMIGLPKETMLVPHGCEEIQDPWSHPLAAH